MGHRRAAEFRAVRPLGCHHMHVSECNGAKQAPAFPLRGNTSETPSQRSDGGSERGSLLDLVYPAHRFLCPVVPFLHDSAGPPLRQLASALPLAISPTTV